MSYQTYTTDAIVCGTNKRNTADCSYLLFTRDHGMVLATARSVREERSKQRYALQDFSFIKVSLIKGKTGWRIGSAEVYNNAYYSATKRPDRQVLLQCIKLIRRLVHGEVPLPTVFTDLEKLAEVLVEKGDIALSAAELFTYRTLQTLGYIDNNLLTEINWLQEDCEVTAKMRKSMDNALQQSHL